MEKSSKIIVIALVAALAIVSALLAVSTSDVGTGVSLADTIQTLGIMGTILFTLWQFKREDKTEQEKNDRHLKDLGYNTYLQSSLAYLELEKLMLQHRELEKIYEQKEAEYTEEEKKKALHWYYMFFMILEVVWHAKEREWIDKKTEWGGWDKTVTDLSGDKLFKVAWCESRDHYSDSFKDYVDNLLAKSAHSLKQL